MLLLALGSPEVVVDTGVGDGDLASDIVADGDEEACGLGRRRAESKLPEGADSTSAMEWLMSGKIVRSECM